MKTILIVDDDKNFAELLKQSLSEDFGYEIIINLNGLIAYETIASNNIDLAICDTEMPVMGGLELKSKLNIQKIKIPFIGISGNPKYKEAWNRLGSDFLEKPFKMQELYKTIEANLK